MTVVLWLAAWVATAFVLVSVWCAGHTHGEAKAARQWRQLFVELGVDHGHELERLEGQLACADQTIFDLHRDMGVAFRAGQVFQAERKDVDL